MHFNNTGITSLDASNNTRMWGLDIEGVNLAWLHIGNHAYLTDLYWNNNSAVDLGEIDGTFNIKEKFPGIDLNKITSISGANLDKATGMVSGYTNGTPISYTYDCGISKYGTVTLDVALSFNIIKGQSSITIHDDLNKVYDGGVVSDPVNITKTGSAGAVTLEWYMADGTPLQTAPVNVGSYKVKAILAEDGTQVGIWTILVGLSTGIMMYFRKKNRKEEV